MTPLVCDPRGFAGPIFVSGFGQFEPGPCEVADSDVDALLATGHFRRPDAAPEPEPAPAPSPARK